MKPTCSQLVKKFPAFYGTRRFISAFTSALHLSLLYLFWHLLHHSRHVSNSWVHHQGLTYTYPFALYGFPYGIRQLFLILHCFRKTSVQGNRQWSCAIWKGTKKNSNIIKPMTLNQKIWIILRTVHKTTTSKMDELDGTKCLFIQ